MKIADKKYKHISIKQVNQEVFNDKPVWRIFNNKPNEQIGIISYYLEWKKFVFSSQPNIVFDVTCLRCILSFVSVADHYKNSL